MNRSLLVDGIGTLATLDGTGRGGLGLVHDAALWCVDGRVAFVGPRHALPTVHPGTHVVDVEGRAVLPGFVDCHTHLIFAGDRADEFAMRARGESYAAIMAAGGGIRSTMRRVRAASIDELVAQTRVRLDDLLARGVTTVEMKSGYGLDVDNELKMLHVVRALQGHRGMTLVPTLLAAHAVPPEHEGNADAWIDVIVRELLPVVVREGLATSCDIFVEQGAFTVAHGRRLLGAARDAGLQVRVHAEQMSHQGGAQLAAEFGAASVGHLEHVTPQDADALAKAGVVCEVLSTAQVYLRGQRPIPGRMLVDAGCTIAVATDCNPGTAMSTDLPLAAGLAVTQCGLRAEEAIAGITVGGARALGLSDRGRLVVGMRADAVVLDGTNVFDVVYRWGLPPAHTVVVDGALVAPARDRAAH